METKIYFVRHAQPDFSIVDDSTRPLTKKGKEDSASLVKFFLDKEIDLIYSSPYKRSKDTIKPIAEIFNTKVNLIDNFRERKISNQWINDFTTYSKKQWNDFDYKLIGGESLKDVQNRNIFSLKHLLNLNKGKRIVVGTHGTALSTIINFYDKTFGYEQFLKIKNIMPLIITFAFSEDKLISIKSENDKKIINIEL